MTENYKSFLLLSFMIGVSCILMDNTSVGDLWLFLNNVLVICITLLLLFMLYQLAIKLREFKEICLTLSGDAFIACGIMMSAYLVGWSLYHILLIVIPIIDTVRFFVWEKPLKRPNKIHRGVNKIFMIEETLMLIAVLLVLLYGFEQADLLRILAYIFGLGFAAIGVGIMQMSRLQAYYPKETRLPFIFVSIPAALLLLVAENETSIRQLYTRVLMSVVIVAILWVDHLRCKG